MHPLRRALCLICASALLLAGLWLLPMVLMAERVKGLSVFTATGLIGTGGVWLWADVGEPLLGRYLSARLIRRAGYALALTLAVLIFLLFLAP